jgi:hypothetical protein
MAKMIPELDITTMENKGEKCFYEAASSLSNSYTVLYGYKYLQDFSKDLVREADFIIIHPQLGFLVVEVKQGDIAFHNGQWHEVKQGGYLPLHKNPVEQARSAMYQILRHYRIQHQNQDFPLIAKYVLCFPDCTTFAGSIPVDLLVESVWLKQNMNNIEASIQSLLGTAHPQKSSRVGESLIKMLSPDFKLFTVLKDQIDSFSKSSLHILNDEQERIIDETLLDKRKLFLGTAGTGKTFIAIEKARRSVLEGKKVLLTCFNIHLANWMQNQMVNLDLSIGNFHVFLEKYLQDRQSWIARIREKEIGTFKLNWLNKAMITSLVIKNRRNLIALLLMKAKTFKRTGLSAWKICLKKRASYIYLPIRIRTCLIPMIGAFFSDIQHQPTDLHKI